MTKRSLFAFAAAAAVCFSLTACKSNEENRADQIVSAPNASELPNVSRDNTTAEMPANNGMVTDTNGFIGDADDTVRNETDRNANRNPIGNAAEQVGDAVNNAADKVGDTASNLASNAGNIVSNVTSNVGDSVSNIADNAGDVVENATDNASEAAESR